MYKSVLFMISTFLNIFDSPLTPFTSVPACFPRGSECVTLVKVWKASLVGPLLLLTVHKRTCVPRELKLSETLRSYLLLAFPRDPTALSGLCPCSHRESPDAVQMLLCGTEKGARTYRGFLFVFCCLRQGFSVLL